MEIQVRWTDGEVARLRRRVAEALTDREPREACRLVAEVASEFGVTAPEVREILARDERGRQAHAGRTARDASSAQVWVSPDIYSHERSGLLEKLGRLSGGAIQYGPGARTDHPDKVPFEHTLAMATEWLARNPESPHDVAGDVILALALMHVTPVHEDRIVRTLSACMVQGYGLARRMRESLRDACCRSIVLQCVYGVAQLKPPKATAAQWGLHQGLGVRELWVIADRGLRRAAQAMGYAEVA